MAGLIRPMRLQRLPYQHSLNREGQDFFKAWLFCFS